MKKPFWQVLLFVISPFLAAERCTLSQFRFGQWIPGAANCGLLEQYPISKHQQPGPYSKWCWKPNNCEPVKFSARDYCRLMKDKAVLMVGDSLLYSMYQAFYGQLETQDPIEPPLNQWESKRYYKGQGKVCGGNSSIVFIRNDHLTITGEADFNTNNRPTNKLWKRALPYVDAVIFNKGHHVTLKEVSEEQFVEMTQSTMVYLKNHIQNVRKRPLLVYFLETSPGHAFCVPDSHPNTTVLNSTEDFNAFYDIYRKSLSRFPLAESYGWGMYRKHDEFLEEIFTTELNATALPITQMSFLRPDGHIVGSQKKVKRSQPLSDCLHYHLPSVVDNWVYVFYNALLADLESRKML